MGVSRVIKVVVEQFEQARPSERYEMLEAALEGSAQSARELSWRVQLVTALREADVYPKRKPRV